MPIHCSGGIPIVYPYYIHLYYSNVYRPSTVIVDNGFFNKTTIVHYMKLRIIITSGVIKKNRIKTDE